MIEANANVHKRSMVKVPPKSRKRCPCCKFRATHIGTANGVAMMIGCELRVRRWVKNPNIYRPAIRDYAKKNKKQYVNADRIPLREVDLSTGSNNGQISLLDE